MFMPKPRKVPPKALEYAKGIAANMGRTEAMIAAGYSPTYKPSEIEATLDRHKVSVSESLLKHISLDQITEHHADLIRSENEMVSLGATKLAYERIEPDGPQAEDVESVTIVMRG